MSMGGHVNYTREASIEPSQEGPRSGSPPRKEKGTASSGAIERYTTGTQVQGPTSKRRAWSRSPRGKGPELVFKNLSGPWCMCVQLYPP